MLEAVWGGPELGPPGAGLDVRLKVGAPLVGGCKFEGGPVCGWP